MDHNKLGFLFSDVNQHAPKRQPNGPSEPASKRPKPDSTERPHKRPADGHHKSTTPGTKSSHQHKVPSSDSKKKVPPKVKRPVIEDSDEDDDDIDGNLFSRKKNVTTVPVQSANKPTKSVKTEKRKESSVHKPKPEQDKKFQVKVEKKSPETPNPPSTKQQTKSSTSVAKGRMDKQNSVPVKSEVKSEPMETSSKEKHDKKTKRLSAGSKRQHEEDSEDDFSVSSLSDDEDESSDEPVALGLNSESDDSYSDRDDDFKAKKSKPRLKAEAKKETPKSASTTTKKVSAKKEPKKIEKSSPAVTKTTPVKKKDKPATPLKKESDSPQKKKKKEEEREVWKWWEEERLPEGIKWKTLEHKGPYFPPLYEPLPKHVKFLYDGKPVALAPDTEEVAGFFGKMLEHEYTKKDIFIQNFWSDWRKVMTAEEAKLIRDFRKCNFSQINQYYKDKSEARKQMSKEEKLKIKEENEQIIEEYGWALMDGHKERIGNFKIEPPGLFRGRGDHPKQGMIKKRVQPEDVTINIGKDAKIPAPPDGHKWKAVSHDNSVTWLASWTENIQGQIKYVMLNPTSRIKGEKDWMKYETARKLKTCVDAIRKQYYEDLKSKEMRIRQRATALYFIDKLALRAGNEKDPDESADTVGCCSLRVEHIKLHEALDGETNVVEFDFLGKDSIRYQNHVSVDKQVFKNLRLFTKGKDPGHDLFDRLSTSDLNKHLQELMEGLTAKVFRTYNASNTLQEQLALLTSASDLPPAKILSYNRANRAVAVLCNHQRAPPKTFDQQMENLQKKIDAKKDSVKEAEKDMKDAKKSGDKKKVDVAKRKVERLKEQLHKLELQATDKEENKEIALGTSKLNYLDPRISVSWCKKWDIPVEKVYNKTQRQKFAWAIDMADDSFVF